MKQNRFDDLIRDVIDRNIGENLDYIKFIDSIPDSDIVDEPAPFPYGGGSKDFNKWALTK